MPHNVLVTEFVHHLHRTGLLDVNVSQGATPDEPLSPAIKAIAADLFKITGDSSFKAISEWTMIGQAQSPQLQAAIEFLTKPRCGNPKGKQSPLSIQTFGTPSGRWSRGVLTYSIDPRGCNLAAAQVTTIIDNVFAQWQAVTPFFSFSRVPSGGDILLAFAGAETDSRFGAKSGVVATGAPPEQGRIFFDNSETWTEPLLRSVGLHELGHALGLTHSNDRNSVMYPIDMTFAAIDPESQDALRMLHGWAPQVPLPDRATSDRPSLAYTGSVGLFSASYLLHMVWKGSRDDQGIYESSLVNNVWTPQEKIHGIGSTESPALTAILTGDGTTSTALLMAWRGVKGDQGLYWSTTRFGSWSPQAKVGISASSDRPALGVYPGGIYLAWKGIDGDQGIYFSTFDGNDWSPQTNMYGVGTSASPALATLNGVLYMFWKGVEGDSNLYYSSLDAGPKPIWQPQRKVAFVTSKAEGAAWQYPGTTHGPSATLRGNRILLAWKGVEGDQGIYFSLFDGNEFSGQIQVKDVGTSQGPGVCTFGAFTHMAWKGVEGDNILYWSTL
ncbi:matrixin family metalloprotease [Pseudogulbenkiania subflava]|uniref:Matrixin n=1 Tax=Pseudogulbenkiania subflava DSM 22618 TaxID=1123014 RepID=A0A1Y6BPL7_9NEIS|nr:matrixin family metalloprotease [Pseudogulbenkiania subflava]SMF22018.1 Matrixin [Pseudogulbenkiania subflava DSM 22618]